MLAKKNSLNYPTLPKQPSGEEIIWSDTGTPLTHVAFSLIVAVGVGLLLNSHSLLNFAINLPINSFTDTLIQLLEKWGDFSRETGLDNIQERIQVFSLMLREIRFE